MSKQQGIKPANYSMSNKMRVALSAAFIFSLILSLSFRDSRRAVAQQEDKRAGQPAAQPAVPTAAAPGDEVSPQAADVTFGNAAPITINDNSTASPYPSNITVNNPSLTTVTKVQVALYQFTHTFPDDVDIILVGPGGQRRAMLMSDAGGGEDVLTPGINLTFSSTAATALPDTSPPVLTAGAYRPANYGNTSTDLTDTFPAPGPGALTNEPTDLSVFNLTNPNGTWSLYVVDDAGVDVGQIAGGWGLILTAPTIFTVNSTADTTDGTCNAANCTLREAITAAQNGDLINFSTLFDTPQTINLLTALPDINRSVTIVGKGANLLTVRRDYNAATDFRIFTIPAGVANGVAISGMTITGGRAADFGGGIDSQSNLTLTNVHVTGNQSVSAGGGVYLEGDGVFTGCTFSGNIGGSQGGGINFEGNGRTLRFVNSTVSGNRANDGGGIMNISGSDTNSRLEVTSSTIANNNAVRGGGILTVTQNSASSTATTTLRNTILAGNTANNLQTETFNNGGAATFQTLGFNLSDNFTGGGFTPIPGSDITSATPRLGPLSLGGGTTPTHALLGGSPAIDKGNASGLGVDQRGVARGSDVPSIPNASDGSDIGAVEMQALIVTSTAVGGTGTLVNILSLANSNPALTDIIFDPAVFDTAQTITLTGELPIFSNVTINGAGANLLTVSGNNNSRVFFINSGFTATLSGMTITGGNGVGGTSSGTGGGILNNGSLTVTHSAVSGNTASGFGGGGIRNINAGTLTVSNSTISGNTANGTGTSGGIDSSGNLTVINSTISDNRAPNGGGNGGGIWTNGFVVITNSTIANNSAAGANSAGGVLRISATVTIRNSIVAGNVNNSTVPDVVANGGGGTGITSNGFNLIGNRGNVTFNQMGDQSGTGASPLSPGLTALGANGGTTPTHALLFGSAALDAGSNSGSGTLTDQRGTGFNRTIDLPLTNAPNSDGTDIGAFETSNPAPTAAATAANVTTAGASTYTFTVTYTDDTGINVSTIGTGNVQVTGPNGFAVQPAFLFVNSTSNGTPRTATYRFTPPGGSWDIGDNGAYNIVMNANQVADISGDFVPTGNIGSFTVNILPTISINDPTTAEGDPMIFTITLSAPYSGTVTLTYNTTGGTATPDVDYNNQNAPATLTFAPNTTTQTVSVPTFEDSTNEPDETFNLNILSAINATIADNQGIGTIVNDDAEPTISISDVSQNEGNAGTSNFDFTVSLSNASSQTVTVRYATADGTAIAGSDYTGIGSITPLTFNAGETSKTLTIPVNGDTTVEPNETFFVNLVTPTNATIADNQGIGTIQNDDACPTITLSQLPGGTVGTAYNQTISGSGGTAPYTFAVTAGTLPNGLTLSSGGVLSGTPTVSGTFNFTVTATDANGCTGTRAYSFFVACSGSITLPSLPNGTVGTSYNGSVAASPAGSYSYSVTSGALPNGLNLNPTSGAVTGTPTVANSFSFTITATTPGNCSGSQSYNVTIAPAALPTISINDVSQNEGNAGTSNFNFTVSLSNASTQTVTVRYQTADGTATAPSDYTAIGATTLTFNAGETIQQVSVSVAGDTTAEPNETFFVNLSNPTNATISDNQGQGTIVNDDSTTISINDVSQSEGNGGSSNFAFTVSLSAASAQTVTVSYQTADGTATADSDYTAVGATVLTFNAGETSKQVSVSVNGDTTVEPDETFFVNLSNPTNATISDNQGQGTIVNDDSAPPPPTFAFSSANYNVGEADPRATVFVIRSGDTTGSATVDYRTQDTDTFTVGCADVVNNQGGAYGRCDFATAVGTLAFAPGQTQQQFTVPIINDVHVEGLETFSVQLGNATGATLGTPGVATITILDNDTAGQPNPVFEPNPANTARTIPFFVRQQYLDFLSREPETGEPWSGVLNRCLQLSGGDPQNINNLNPNSPSAGCDRIIVSLSFFGSPEFQLKGFYVFRFYKLAYNRLPEYLEIIPDMSFVAGQTEQEVYDRRAQLATLFTGRQEFVTTYGSLPNAEYVNALLARYQLTQITTPDPADPDGAVKVTLTNADLLNRLNASTLTRAQVFRAIADSDEVNGQEFNNAFVGMQYYGYLRRIPDPAGYQAWLQVLQSGQPRTMVNGFLNSVEYRLRFGQP